MHPLTGLDPIQVWETARPIAIGLVTRYGPDVIRAGVLKLSERIRHDPPSAQANAETNARSYVSALASVLNGLYSRGRLTEDELARAVASPAIARVLESAVLTASLSNDEQVHRELAWLVAARLGTSDDSTLAFNLRDAAERLESLSGRHLRALAVVYFAKYGAVEGIDPAAPEPADLDRILGWVAPRAAALGSPTLTFDEAQHLDGLHLVKYRGASGYFEDPEYDYSALQQQLTFLVYPGLELGPHLEAYRWLGVATSQSLEHVNASRMAMTPVGAILGYTACCDLIGEEPDFSMFE